MLATLLGFVVGIARLSPNWLVARLAGGYVELIRNLPLLFQILFWYLAVLGTLPGRARASRSSERSSSTIAASSCRRSGSAEGIGYVMAALALGVLATIALGMLGQSGGASAPDAAFRSSGRLLALIVGLPLATFLRRRPADRGWICRACTASTSSAACGIIPEFVALLIALSTYTAAFIAEIVRAGILAVPRGQSEAALALGLRRGQLLRLVLVPQALRVIVPPLTNQYLNLTKNSSLAVAIGYPDLFAVFAGTTLNQTGQAIEIIAITMAVYLSLSLVTSVLMNWYNSRVRLVDR